MLVGKRFKAQHLAPQVIFPVGGGNPCIEHRAALWVGFVDQDGAGGKLVGGNGELARLPHRQAVR